MSRRTEVLLNEMYAADVLKFGESTPPAATPKKRLRGKTKGQQEFLEAIRTAVVTICTGVAGTGKTYIPIARAMEMLIDGETAKVVIARPIVECGEKLGSLPGTMGEKIEPYLKAIYDVMAEFLEKRQMNDYLKNEVIEFCPLAYMRGRTFNNAIIILDEAQNATKEQIRMFLTRIGQNCRAIVSGDITQCDLDRYRCDAYKAVAELFDAPPYVDGVQLVKLTSKDVVRSDIVQRIIEKFGF